MQHITRRYLAQRYGVSEHTIRKYVYRGILPPPAKKGGPGVTYDPICLKILDQLLHIREYFTASLDELAERRQLTGQLLPPDARQPPVMARGPV